MSNRLYNQFSYSTERQPISLMGKFTQTTAHTKASLISNGITYTADAFGPSGNSITIEIVAGGTAGAEVVTVVGNAISIEIEDAVSTRTEVETAINASIPASALISISVASGGTAASLLVETPLAGGANTVFSSNAMNMSISQTDIGIYTIQLEDEFPQLLSAQVTLLSATAEDLTTQLVSEATAFGTAKTVVIRTLTMSAAVETDMSDDMALLVHLILRNSSN